MSNQPKLKRKKVKTITAADLYCGAGGSSSGLYKAAAQLGVKVELTAVNHWEVAIATHSKNHPDARHFCKAVDSINPLELFETRKLDIVLASPSCVHHSRARGGKPKDEQKRADAWDLLRWTEKLYIKTLIIENVREFMEWGPLDEKGNPLKSKKGFYFRQFIDCLRGTYTVEWRVLNCADYGDPTTRERFFLIAKRGLNKKIVFPEPSHASRKILAKNQPNLFTGSNLKTWVSAREIIDWSLEGKNIFGRKKVLSENTMKRIYAGLRKYSGIDIPERQFSDDPIEQAELDVIYQSSPIKLDLSKLKGFTMGTGGPTGQQTPRSTDEPLRTILTDPRQNVFAPQMVGLEPDGETPFIINNSGTTRRDRDVSEPTFTQRTGRTQGIVEPWLLNQKSSARKMRSVDEPLFTQTAHSRHQYVVQPYMVNLSHTKSNDEAMCKDLDNPVITICGKGMLGVVEPFFVSYHGGKKDGGINRSHELAAPVPTLDTSNRFGLVESFIVPCNHGKNDVRAHSLNDPMKTVTGVDADALVEPFLTKFYGGHSAASVDETLPTITANYEHYGLAEPFLVKYNNNQDAQNLSEPLATVTTKDHFGFGQPFMIQFYGERSGQNPRTRDIDAPVWTVTPQIRMGIVEPFLVKMEDAHGAELHGLLLWELGAILIVNFRMLQQKELAAAMSFPPDYYFHGTRDEQVKQIGNAVACKTAEALCLAVLQN